MNTTTAVMGPLTLSMKPGAQNGNDPGEQLGKAHEQPVGELVHVAMMRLTIWPVGWLSR